MRWILVNKKSVKVSSPALDRHAIQTRAGPDRRQLLEARPGPSDRPPPCLRRNLRRQDDPAAQSDQRAPPVYRGLLLLLERMHNGLHTYRQDVSGEAKKKERIHPSHFFLIFVFPLARTERVY